MQQDRTTPFGVVRTWTSPPVAGTLRPMVFAIPGVLAAMDDIVAVGESLGLLADMCIMRLPSHRDAALSISAAADLSRMVGGLIEEMFPDRPVVLFGVSSGALMALGVRARNLARIIAVEPPLATGDLWPITDQLRAHLKAANDPITNAFTFETFGFDETRSEARSQLDVLDGLNVPVDVVLGEEPLQPRRDVTRFPSLVGEAERRALAAIPGLTLHVIPATGHNVVGQARRTVRDLILEGCRRAAALRGPERLRVDEPLLEAVPLTARSVLFVGAGGRAFAAALLEANPKCEVVLAHAPGELSTVEDRAFDVVVSAGPPAADVLSALASRLRHEGLLIARWALGDDDLRSVLTPHGLTLREPLDESGTGVMRAQKLAPGEAPRPTLALMFVAYATLLMDIRTRLPVQGLRTDPNLRVTYVGPPFQPLNLPRDHPKVLVLQRPAEARLESWRPFVANMIRDGWLVVLEYDDNPALIVEVKGEAAGSVDMAQFGYVHAVQTSTPPLVEVFKPYNPETMMFPNAAFSLLPFPEGERPARVFYGGVLRGRYPVEVARALAPAIARCPETEFVVIGDRQVFDALPTDAKKFYEYMPFEAYLNLMSQCAISLSPIEALPLREMKSDAKFLDAARAGVLTIASPTIYDRVIEHGVNGLLAPRVEDWAPLLTRALTEPDWSRAMARRAWAYVRDERMFADQVALRRDWYLDLWSRRDALNAALLARMPGLRELVSAS